MLKNKYFIQYSPLMLSYHFYNQMKLFPENLTEPKHDQLLALQPNMELAYSCNSS